VLVLSILVTILAIGVGFDSINGEYNRRTMSRILAQPIYRDALLFGKFLAGIATLSICLITLWLLVIGFGLIRLGIPPSGEELGRLLIFLLSPSPMPASGSRSPCCCRSGALDRDRGTDRAGLWLFLALLWPARGADDRRGDLAVRHPLCPLGLPTPDTLMWQQGCRGCRPARFTARPGGAAQSRRPVDDDLARAIPGPHRLAAAAERKHPAAWPQMVSLIAGTILLYVIGYVAFSGEVPAPSLQRGEA
jgi:ABC-2 type transport system permease protein